MDKLRQTAEVVAQEHGVNTYKPGIQEFTVLSFDLQSPLSGAPQVTNSDINYGGVQAIWECDETAVPQACASPWRCRVPDYLITPISQRKVKAYTTS